MNEKGIFLKNIYALMTGSDRPTLSGVDMRIDNGKVNRIGVVNVGNQDPQRSRSSSETMETTSKEKPQSREY